MSKDELQITYDKCSLANLTEAKLSGHLFTTCERFSQEKYPI